MSKRHLTRRQLKHLKHLHSKRLERAQRQQELIQETDTAGLGPERPGLLVAHYGATLIIESPEGSLVPCSLRQNLGTLVTGDNVIWQAIDDTRGVVIASLPRRTELTRPDKQGSRPIVANVDQMLIVLAYSPLPQATTLDRYLVLAKSHGISPLVALNKIDLPAEKGGADLVKRLESYPSLGYPVFKISTQTQEGLPPLIAALKDHSTLVVGQSGVGKSSLLSALLPDVTIRTQALSQKNRLGQQTTTATTLYHLPQGGSLIDSPGIHQFNLHHFSPSMIFEGFTEFSHYRGHCKFRNCEHKHEPGCALIAAVQQGELRDFRLDNYHKILADKDQWL